MNKKIIIFAIALILILLVGVIVSFYVFSQNKNQEIVDNLPISKIDKFADCLSKTGIIMYGNDFCPACKKQRRMFSQSFRFINYVNCMLEPQKCIDKKINNIPTWVFPNNERLVGFQSFEKLSQVSGCQIEL